MGLNRNVLSTFLNGDPEIVFFKIEKYREQVYERRAYIENLNIILFIHFRCSIEYDEFSRLSIDNH